MKISNFFKQDGNELITTRPMVLTIDKTNYDTQTFKENANEEQIWVKSLLSTVEYEDKIFNVTLDYDVTLYATDVLKNNKETVKLAYKALEPVLEAASDMGDNSVEISYVERLIGGRELLKDATHLYRKLYGMYGKLSDMDSIHIEILCGQVLRDKNNLHIPARLGKTWDPILINMKQVVYAEGFIPGLAFENIGEALRTGLITEESKEPSILERVLTGELSDKEK